MRGWSGYGGVTWIRRNLLSVVVCYAGMRRRNSRYIYEYNCVALQFYRSESVTKPKTALALTAREDGCRLADIQSLHWNLYQFKKCKYEQLCRGANDAEIDEKVEKQALHRCSAGRWECPAEYISCGTCVWSGPNYKVVITKVQVGPCFGNGRRGMWRK